MSNLILNNITLVAMTSVNIPDTISALLYSSKDIDFYSIKIITHEPPENLCEKIEYNYIDRIDNINQWNYNIFYNLYKYIESEYAILIHDDGFIVNHSSWQDDFLKYDYIGAPWDHSHFLDKQNNKIRVGNSVSLRSKKIMELPSKLNIPWAPYDGNFNEDTQICVWNRDILLDNGVIYADYDVAKYFSHEQYFDDYFGIKPFCFHNFGDKNQIYKKYITEFKNDNK